MAALPANRPEMIMKVTAWRSDPPKKMTAPITS
jgi:hypothetical protein